MKTKITIITAFVLAALFINACDAGQAKFEPKAVIQEYVTALKEKDVAKIKAASSAKTVALLEVLAKQQKLSLEEMIAKNEPQIAPILENPELRDEKVEGDKATVEVKNPADGKWNKVTFVKEDNRWKLGAGEMVDDIQKQIDEMRKGGETKMETPPAESNTANSNAEMNVEKKEDNTNK